MSMINPWKRLSSRTVYTNPWITVREDQVVRPDGTPGIYGVVETRIANGVVALTDKNEVIMVGQYRYPIEQYSWEIVEGGSDSDEAPLSAMQRELREEAGYSATSWQQLGPPVHLSNCFSSEVAYCFLARGLIEGKATPDGDEVLQVKKVPFAQVMQMVRTGEISDAITIMAMYRAADELGIRL